MACKTCRTRKIKCDQTRPVCQNCQLRLSHCTYEGERRKRRWTDSGSSSGIVGHGSNGFGGDMLYLGEEQYQSFGSDGQPDVETTWPRPRVSTIPTVWKTATTSITAATTSATTATTVLTTVLGENGQRDGAQQQYMQVLPSVAAGQSPSTSTSSVVGMGRGPMHQDNAIIQRQGLETAVRDVPDTLLDNILRIENGDSDGKSSETRNPVIWMRTNDGDEFTGPSSGISVISDVGLQWLREKVPNSELLCQTIQDIRSGLLGHLRQPKCIPRGLPVTPQAPRRLDHVSPSQVLRYVDAYFTSVQIVFPILDRVVFLSKLERYGTCAGVSHVGDTAAARPSWMALLSAVLASGCRAALSDETAEAFQVSGREAWSFFQDALFYERPMEHDATDLESVQALAVMTVFAQGLSSPQRLEYTLCSLAVRQAQAIGLNHQPSPTWQLSADEQGERSRVFWAIYCLDKTVALRCGRPGNTYDSDISCHFPRGIRIPQPASNMGKLSRGSVSNDNCDSSSSAALPADINHSQPSLSSSQKRQQSPSPQTYDFFLCFTRLARICGAISRGLYSATAISVPVVGLLHTMQRLLNDLEAWRTTIPPDIQPGRPLGRMQDAAGLTRVQVVILHSSYYYSLCAIYRRFSPLFTHQDETAHALICSRMDRAYVQAARSMVLLTKHLDTESFTPGWLVFYYPLTALAAIFIHVITHPSDVSSSNDIALMEAVVGLFGRLEYVTSGEAAFTKTADFVRQARSVVERWNESRGSDDSVLVPRSPEISSIQQQKQRENGHLHDRPYRLQDVPQPFQPPTDTFIISPMQAMSRADVQGDMVRGRQDQDADSVRGQDRRNSANFGSDLLDTGVLESPENELPPGDWLDAWTSNSHTSTAERQYF